ncbi:OmpH family outer membrane protein [Crocinitomicaceae bacterium]|nr:OmpH family outer membrane protein [Crocinitomicaceae bacterium]
MRVLILLTVLIFGTGFANSQRYAYIDSDYILQELTEYSDAKAKLDKLANRWTSEIEKRYDILKLKKDNFLREEVLLPAEEKERRAEEIKTLETEAMQMQKTRFGVEGDYFQKRQELIKPIQDQIYEAMQTVASRKKYVMVFDKANQSNLVYADPKLDISILVLKELGVKVR